MGPPTLKPPKPPKMWAEAQSRCGAPRREPWYSVFKAGGSDALRALRPESVAPSNAWCHFAIFSTAHAATPISYSLLIRSSAHPRLTPHQLRRLSARFVLCQSAQLRGAHFAQFPRPLVFVVIRETSCWNGKFFRCAVLGSAT